MPQSEMHLLQCLLLVGLALLPSSRGQVEETCAAQGDGFRCVNKEKANEMKCIPIATDADIVGENLCTGAFGDGKDFCCRPREPAQCKDLGCSRKYKGFLCIPQQDAQSWPKVCSPESHTELPKLCGLLDGSQCGCCAPKYVECEDVSCSNRKGYKCINEMEAYKWPVPCHQSDRQCKKNCFIHDTGSRPYSLYNVDPNCPSPEDCQLKCQAFSDCKYFNYVPAASTPSGCWLLKYNKKNETSAVSTIGWVTGPKYCSKCYCCPPKKITDPCEDTGCKEEFDGQGKCKDVEQANWNDLDADFDLAAGSNDTDNCRKKGANRKDTCCRCLKKKRCLDVGCEEEFGGHGICIDKSKADIANLTKTIDFPAGEKSGKCRNAVTFKEDCCSCYKKKTPECWNKECKTSEGLCLTEGVIPPPNHFKSFSCNPTLNCNCWVPVPRCDDDQCEGKCFNKHERPPTGFTPNGYECNGNKLCLCYVEGGCQDNICAKEMKGKCISPDDEKPAGFVKSKHNCNGKIECPCYVPDGCQDDHCAGTCINISHELPPAGLIPNGYKCNDNKQCLCYAKAGCQDDNCPKVFKGQCIGADQEKPAGYAFASYYCNSTKECPCYVPVECTLEPSCRNTLECRKERGYCFSEEPAGLILVQGAKCRENCSCYKKPEHCRA